MSPTYYRPPAHPTNPPSGHCSIDMQQWRNPNSMPRENRTTIIMKCNHQEIRMDIIYVLWPSLKWNELKHREIRVTKALCRLGDNSNHSTRPSSNSQWSPGMIQQSSKNTKKPNWFGLSNLPQRRIYFIELWLPVLVYQIIGWTPLNQHHHLEHPQPGSKVSSSGHVPMSAKTPWSQFKGSTDPGGDTTNVNRCQQTADVV